MSKLDETVEALNKAYYDKGWYNGCFCACAVYSVLIVLFFLIDSFVKGFVR